MSHIPVLLKEVVKYLDVRPNFNYVDCTYGFGGHSAAILERNAPNGKVLGIEIDSEIVERFKNRIPNPQSPAQLFVINDSYRNLKKIIEKNTFKPIHGILFDLGMSMWHIKESGRGFSFLKDETLDMRFSKSALQASTIINQWPVEDIEDVLKEYGEERFARNIAQGILAHRNIRKISRTTELIEIIKNSVPAWYCRKKIHYATKTFQALRIATNHELESLGWALPQAIEVIEKEGRIVIISFHSLEDRIVKTIFRRWEEERRGHIVTKKPVGASLREKRINPASRSAKLRAFEKD